MTTYTYRDSIREEWKVYITPEDIGQEHWEWSYSIKKEHIVVHDGVIRGQFDIEPSIQDIMGDFLNSMNHLAMGFVKDGKELV